MNSCWNVVEPIGEPKTRSPLTSACILVLFGEYVLMAVLRLLLSVGFSFVSLSSIDCPDVEVIILVLSVFMIAPSGIP